MKIQIGQAQLIVFTLLNDSGVLVTGLDDDFIVQISKNGGVFAASAGTKDEIGSGWYSYGLTAAETDTEGPLAIKITHASIAQKNLDGYEVVGYAPAIPAGTNILTAYESLPELCWRLVHDGVTVIALFEGIGYTWTRNNLFCATTEKECLDEIAKKGLKYIPKKDISAQKVKDGI